MKFNLYWNFQINLIQDVQTGKPRGYAFIEYEKESDMHGKCFIKTIALVFLYIELKIFSSDFIFSIAY
jgi:hypothetical protein